MSSRLQDLDCTARMFLSCLCLTECDLSSLGVWPKGQTCCFAAETQARSVVHRLLRDDERLAVAVTDLLDLRFADEVAHVLSLPLPEVALESSTRGRQGVGAQLVGWAWALLRDERAEVTTIGRHLMGSFTANTPKTEGSLPPRRSRRRHRKSAVH